MTLRIDSFYQVQYLQDAQWITHTLVQDSASALDYWLELHQRGHATRILHPSTEKEAN